MHWFLVSELQISFIGVPFQDAMLHLTVHFSIEVVWRSFYVLMNLDIFKTAYFLTRNQSTMSLKLLSRFV